MPKTTASSSSSSSIEKVFSARINPELVRLIRILAAERGVKIHQLVEEGMTDLLKKYKKL